MEWTRALPTEPGFYWAILRYFPGITVVEVGFPNGHLSVWDDGEWTRSTAYGDDMGIAWWGKEPITPPDPPTPAQDASRETTEEAM